MAVPASLVLNLGEDPQAAVDFARQTGYPLFVKPVKAGSSYGISQIHQEEELLPALDLAFQYDNQVILEETIPGRWGQVVRFLAPLTITDHQLHCGLDILENALKTCTQ